MIERMKEILAEARAIGLEITIEDAARLVLMESNR